ncbi:hypothetical protein ACFLXB_01330 [Chloroflexota bacterium]
MTVIERISYYQNIRNEKPNQQLAKDLAEDQDTAGITEIAAHIRDKNASIRSDCLKVLYEIGYLEPHLITPYVNDFLSLLESKQNRMVWGGMIALSTIADIVPEKIWMEKNKVINAIRKGSVITTITGVKVLSALAAHDRAYSDALFPILITILETCIPRDVPTHAESMLGSINVNNKAMVLDLLKAREEELSKSQMTRLRRVIQKIQEIN